MFVTSLISYFLTNFSIQLGRTREKRKFGLWANSKWSLIICLRYILVHVGTLLQNILKLLNCLLHHLKTLYCGIEKIYLKEMIEFEFFIQ